MVIPRCFCIRLILREISVVMATTRKSIITLVHRQLSSCRLRPHRLRSHQLRSHRLRPRRLWAHRLCLISCALSTLIAQIVHILYEHSACLSHLNSTIITTTRVFYTLVCAEVSNPLHISLRPRLSSSLPSPSLTLFSPSPHFLSPFLLCLLLSLSFSPPLTPSL